jgi:hypothetical protein
MLKLLDIFFRKMHKKVNKAVSDAVFMRALLDMG